MSARSASRRPAPSVRALQKRVPINSASVKFVSRAQLDGPSFAAFQSRLNTLLSVKPGAARMAETAGKKKPRA